MLAPSVVQRQNTEVASVRLVRFPSLCYSAASMYFVVRPGNGSYLRAVSTEGGHESRRLSLCGHGGQRAAIRGGAIARQRGDRSHGQQRPAMGYRGPLGKCCYSLVRRKL